MNALLTHFGLWNDVRNEHAHACTRGEGDEEVARSQ